MRIEIKQNQIVVEFSQKETNFIAQKAGKSKIDEVGNYIKEEITKLFALHEIESDETSGWGHDFNLGTIKIVSDELNKRKGKASQSAQKLESLGFQAQQGIAAVPEVPAIPEVPKLPDMLDIADAPPVPESPTFSTSRAFSEIEADAETEADADAETVAEAEAEIAALSEADVIEEVGDELLADLLDKDLLKGKQKPKKGAS